MQERIYKFKAWEKPSNPEKFKGKMWEIDDDWNFFAHCMENPQEYTIIQYTGLKDKQGKEIYQSDLIIWKGQKEPVEVIWKNQGWYPFVNNTTEIIGNIYEHSELIK